MKPRNRHELEAIAGIGLFVFVILAIVCWVIYERGYLGTAVAIVGVVAVAVGLARALRVRVARSGQVNRSRHQQEEEWQEEWPRWEQEIPPEYGEFPVHYYQELPDYPVPQERREEEGQPKASLERDAIVQRLDEIHEERPLHYEKLPDYPAPQERREEEGQPKASLERDAIVQRLDEMSAEEFERLMAWYFRHQGYAVDTTPAAGDRGADLVIVAAERRICVRLKRQDQPVENKSIREALGGRAFYGAHETWLITNGTFAKGTRYEARVAGVRLVDGDELAGWLDKLADSLEDESQ